MTMLIVIFAILIGIAALFTVPSMTAVHEHMHEKAAEQKCKRQIGNDMLSVVHKNVDTGDHD